MLIKLSIAGLTYRRFWFRIRASGRIYGAYYLISVYVLNCRSKIFSIMSALSNLCVKQTIVEKFV